MGHSKSGSKREVYSHTILTLEKEEQTKCKVSGRKEIITSRTEVNEIEMNKTIAKISEIES